MADSLFVELKRRNVFKVGFAYLVLAWVVIQVTDVAVPALRLPEWVNSLVFFLGLIGFPFAVFFAWAFEVTPEGVVREADVKRGESIGHVTGRKLDFIIIGLLAVGMGYFIYESRFATAPDVVAVADESSGAKSTDEAPKGSSIAVLPFVNMSSDKEQDYFSDGISEEILNVLAQVPNLHVTSRSSSFAFKGKDNNLTEVARLLGVENILEGSIRKSGNQLRITAQLITAGSDKHLWSHSFDRTLTVDNIFEIQDEIAAAVVDSLKSELGLNIQLAVRVNTEVSLDAHNEYLKGRFYIENRNQADLEKALAHFDKATELASEYAPAWVGKAWAISFLSERQYGNLPSEESEVRARSAIEKALQLDPDLPEAHGVMGLIENAARNLDKANNHVKKAIELNPNYATAYAWYSIWMRNDPSEKLAIIKKAVQLDPMSIVANYNYAGVLIMNGRIGEAKDVAEHISAINASHHFTYDLLGDIQLAEGKYAEALVGYEKQIKLSPENLGARFNVARTASAIGLVEKAGDFLKGTLADHEQYWFKGNLELFISHGRKAFPRSDTDTLGNWVRARAEIQAENYPDAVEYFSLTKIGELANVRIFGHLQVGDITEAQELLEKVTIQLNSRLAFGTENVFIDNEPTPIEIRVMEIACLEGDIEKAISNLKLAMDKKYIIAFEYKASVLYKKLREHPEWPAVIAESDKRAAIQREIYLKLSDEEDRVTR